VTYKLMYVIYDSLFCHIRSNTTHCFDTNTRQRHGDCHHRPTFSRARFQRLAFSKTNCSGDMSDVGRSCRSLPPFCICAFRFNAPTSSRQHMNTQQAMAPAGISICDNGTVQLWLVAHVPAGKLCLNGGFSRTAMQNFCEHLYAYALRFAQQLNNNN